MGYKWKYCDLIPDPVFFKKNRKKRKRVRKDLCINCLTKRKYKQHNILMNKHEYSKKRYDKNVNT